MKNRFNLIVVLLTLVTITKGQQKSSNNPMEQIIEREKSFAAAIQTRDTFQTKMFQTENYFLAYTIQGMPIQIVPRQQWLNLLKDYVTESFSIDDIKVNVYGKTAVAMLMFTQKATVRGQERSGQFVITDIWNKEKKGWMIAERHSSRPGPSGNNPLK